MYLSPGPYRTMTRGNHQGPGLIYTESLVYILHSPGLMCISPSLYITSGQDCSKNDTLAICFAISCKCHIVNGSIYYLQDYS